tara:strand:- start:40 stop:270 length:231 start_codon:yes stop_codon:yes gene_type:complete
MKLNKYQKEFLDEKISEKLEQLKKNKANWLKKSKEEHFYNGRNLKEGHLMMVEGCDLRIKDIKELKDLLISDYNEL